MSTQIFNSWDKNATHAQPNDCVIPTPDMFHCPAPKQCASECCPPKTRAKDAILIPLHESERCFALTGWGCDRTQIPLIYSSVRMDIRKKGFCRVLFSMTPIRATMDGNACFHWGAGFKKLEAGYYEADFYIDCKSCTTALLWIPTCRKELTTVETTDISDCQNHSPCATDDCCGVIPTVNVEYEQSKPNPCGECDVECK